MATTARGLAISAEEPEAAEAVDRFTARLARLQAGPEEILADAERQPEVAILQLYAGMLWLYGQTADASAKAAEFLRTAEALVPGMNERERDTFTALRAWEQERYEDALAGFEAIGRNWPRDIVAIKAAEFLYYVLGQQYCGSRFRAHLDALAPDNPDDPDFLAVQSFAHELCADEEGAQALAERALDLAPDQVWAHHSLSHVLITQGNDPTALRRLTSYLPLWQRANRVIYCHNAWHLALVHLDQLDFAGGDAIFRDHIWGVMPDTPGEQVDAISYLWRAEMAGERQDRALWSEIADHTEKRVEETFMPFLNAHYAYALTRAGRTEALNRMLAQVRERSRADDREAREVWRPVGAAVVEACVCLAGELPRRAASLLDPVMDRMPAVGGSDAQCDVFRQTYLSALLGAGRKADARRYWHRMTEWKTRSSLDDAWQARLASA